MGQDGWRPFPFWRTGHGHDTSGRTRRTRRTRRTVAGQPSQQPFVGARQGTTGLDEETLATGHGRRATLSLTCRSRHGGGQEATTAAAASGAGLITTAWRSHSGSIPCPTAVLVYWANAKPWRRGKGDMSQYRQLADRGLLFCLAVKGDESKPCIRSSLCGGGRSVFLLCVWYLQTN